MLVLIGKSKLFLARLVSQARRASSSFVLSLCAKWGSSYSGTIYRHIQQSQQKTFKDRNYINKSVTLARPVFSAECTIGMVWELTLLKCYGNKV